MTSSRGVCVRQSTRGGWGLGVLLILAAGFLAGCGEDVTLPNAIPAVGVESIEAAGATIEIYYTLWDGEGNEVSVLVQFCRDGSCATPTAKPGGDGLTSLPTTRGEGTLHLFRWDVLCDVVAADLGASYTFELTPSDHGSTGTRVTSSAFVPSDLGVTDTGSCGVFPEVVE